MHTIDLLKGQGIPAKTTLGSAAMVVVIVVVPILIAAWMVDRYMQNETYIEIKQESIDAEQKTIDEFADDVKFKESMDQKQFAVNAKLSEVSSSLGRYIQWSPVLETLAEHMPDQMVMSGLKAESRTVQQQAASEEDPQREVTIIMRKLVRDISGSGKLDYGSLVKAYADSLKSSPVLKPKLEDIVFSQNRGRSVDDNTVSYTMDIKFKPGTL